MVVFKILDDLTVGVAADMRLNAGDFRMLRRAFCAFIQKMAVPLR